MTSNNVTSRYDWTRDQLGELLAAEPSYRVNQVWEGLYQHGTEPEQWSNVPKALRTTVAEHLPTALQPAAESVSDDGGTVKWLWTLADGHQVETVLMHYRDRSTVCVSSQAGCAMACDFCATGQAGFDRHLTTGEITEQEYFDKGILMVAMVRAGVELAFEAMVEAGIEPESAYYESLHETPLIANTIARKKLYEMNSIISDTAEYGCYLFAHAAVPLLEDFMKDIDTSVIGKGLDLDDTAVDNRLLVAVNEEIRTHWVEVVGEELRAAMDGMKAI